MNGKIVTISGIAFKYGHIKGEDDIADNAGMDDIATVNVKQIVNR